MGRRNLKVVVLLVACCSSTGAKAQIPIIGDIIGRVITAIDLEVQRIQTQTIGLQEAQKEAENVMSQLRLDDIANWVQGLRDLYQHYFQELYKVKALLSAYHKVYEIVQGEKDLLATYQRAMALFRQDDHFTAAELSHMEDVYGALIAESGRNLDRLENVITDLVFQMTDQQRMQLIDAAAEGLDHDFRDLNDYTITNELLSIGRARDENDIISLKKMYGL